MKLANKHMSRILVGLLLALALLAGMYREQARYAKQQLEYLERERFNTDTNQLRGQE